MNTIEFLKQYERAAEREQLLQDEYDQEYHPLENDFPSFHLGRHQEKTRSARRSRRIPYICHDYGDTTPIFAKSASLGRSSLAPESL